MNIKTHTQNIKYPKATQKIIDNCELSIINGVAHFQGIVNREDWHIQALQMRAGAGGYKPADIFKAIVKYGYNGSEPTFNNFLFKFAKICNFIYPHYEKLDHVKFSYLNQIKLTKKQSEDFYPQSVYDDCTIDFTGEPIESFNNGEECNFNTHALRLMVGKIVSDDNETDLMFKDPGVVSINDKHRVGIFTPGERKLIARLGR